MERVVSLNIKKNFRIALADLVERFLEAQGRESNGRVLVPALSHEESDSIQDLFRERAFRRDGRESNEHNLRNPPPIWREFAAGTGRRKRLCAYPRSSGRTGRRRRTAAGTPRWSPRWRSADTFPTGRGRTRKCRRDGTTRTRSCWFYNEKREWY